MNEKTNEKFTLNIGCHRGTITSRDSESRTFDTYQEAHKSYLESKSFWRGIGYVVWFADIIAPDGTKTSPESNTCY